MLNEPTLRSSVSARRILLPPPNHAQFTTSLPSIARDSLPRPSVDVNGSEQRPLKQEKDFQTKNPPCLSIAAPQLSPSDRENALPSSTSVAPKLPYRCGHPCTSHVVVA